MKYLLSILAVATLSPVTAIASDSAPADSLTKELREITVTSDTPYTKLKGSTLVTTVAGTELPNLGTALDVLAQLPMITADDGNVTVTGRGTPEIYIDGRPMHDAGELSQLQSDNIRRVELLMAPGAMYESTTTAVIKITTRRNHLDGLSVTDRATLTARRKLSADNMLDLNYRTGAWDFFATATAARNNSLIKGSTTNTLDYLGKKTVVGSTQRSEYPSTTQMFKGGFNYGTESRSAGAYYRFNPEQADYTNIGTEWLDDGPGIPRDIDRRIRAKSHLVSVYWEDRLAGKYKIHFDGDFRSSVARNRVMTVYPEGENNDVTSSDSRRSQLWAGKLYLSFPIGKGELNVGTQDSYTHTSLDYRMDNPLIGQYIPSTATEARQTSAALFASWSKAWEKLSLSAGLRYEYVDYLFNVDGVKDHDISRRDNLLTPDISLGYTPDERNQISLSYRMATLRPPYSQLTGSLSYTGRHEIEGGNPALRDEHMHDIQLFAAHGDLMLQADYTRSIDTYAFVKRLYQAPTLQLLMQPVNINVSALYVYLMYGRHIGAWHPEMTLGGRKQWLTIGHNDYNRPIFSYYFDNTFSLPCGFMLTLNASGQTSGDMHTNRFGGSWCVIDASVSKSLFDKALQIKLSATDLFNSRNNDWSMNTFGVFVNKRQSYDRRGISLSLTYRLHPRQSKYKGRSASESELNRL